MSTVPHPTHVTALSYTLRFPRQQIVLLKTRRHFSNCIIIDSETVTNHLGIPSLALILSNGRIEGCVLRCRLSMSDTIIKNAFIPSLLFYPTWNNIWSCNENSNKIAKSCFTQISASKRLKQLKGVKSVTLMHTHLFSCVVLCFDICIEAYAHACTLAKKKNI